MVLSFKQYKSCSMVKLKQLLVRLLIPYYVFSSFSLLIVGSCLADALWRKPAPILPKQSQCSRIFPC